MWAGVCCVWCRMCFCKILFSAIIINACSNTVVCKLDVFKLSDCSYMSLINTQLCLLHVNRDNLVTEHAFRSFLINLIFQLCLYLIIFCSTVWSYAGHVLNLYVTYFAISVVVVCASKLYVCKMSLFYITQVLWFTRSFFCVLVIETKSISRRSFV